MSSVSNDFSRFQIVNLHADSPGRGPFMVTQRGSTPGDLLLAEHDFMLSRTGEWVEWTEVLGGGPGGWEAVIFDSVQEVLEAVETLAGPPRVRPATRSADEVLAQLDRVQSNGGIREEIRRLLAERLARRAGK